MSRYLIDKQQGREGPDKKRGHDKDRQDLPRDSLSEQKSGV